MPIHWEGLPSTGEAPIERSSHSISYVPKDGGLLYLFGGEHDPRVPVSSDIFCYSLKDKSWKRLEAKGIVPAPRIAHSAVVIGDNIWIFGGRSGKDMGEGAKADLYLFSTSTNEWIFTNVDGPVPPSRSYHTACACGDDMYIFGGCGTSGRLNDLWRLDTKSMKWEQLPTNEEIKGRGGSRLVPAPDGSKLYVVAGFAGYELSDMFEFDTKSKSWSPLSTDGLSARSVFGAGVHSCSLGETACSRSGHMILFGGEVDPSDKGHEGAGSFADDVLAWGPVAKAWQKLQPEGNAGPCPRGWFASTQLRPNGELVVHGGLDKDNKRLGDMFILHLH